MDKKCFDFIKKVMEQHQKEYSRQTYDVEFLKLNTSWFNIDDLDEEKKYGRRDRFRTRS